MEQEDNILIKKCMDGDRNAQNALYKKYASKMMAVCYRYSKNREEAEDTLLEGFMKVFDNLHQFSGTGSFGGWMRRIMVNTAIGKFRSQSHLYAVVSLDDDRTNHYAPDDIFSQIGAKELIEMIQKLPPRYQMVFNLFAFEGLKHREIAEQLGITEGTSKSNLSDARAILQKAVNESRMIAKPAVNE